MESNWKSLSNYSRYLVSDCGIVYNKLTKRIISQQKSPDGYQKVSLIGDDEIRKTIYVHRLVALLYVNNEDGKPTVNHKDGIKSNNDYSNLEWATRSEQIQHAWDNNLIQDFDSRKNGIRKLQGKRVICVNTGEIFSSIGEAAEAKNLKKTNISAVCHNKKEFKSAGKDTDGTPLLWRFYE